MTGQMSLIELWSRMNSLPSDPQKPLMLETTARLIPLARQYESGQISKDQFEDARRIVISGFQQGQQNIQQRQQAINDAQAEQLYRIGNQAVPGEPSGKLNIPAVLSYGVKTILRLTFRSANIQMQRPELMDYCIHQHQP